MSVTAYKTRRSHSPRTSISISAAGTSKLIITHVLHYKLLISNGSTALCSVLATFSVTVGKSPWTGGGGPARPKALTHTQVHTNRTNVRISMPRVEFEPTTSVFQLAKTVPALDRATTVTGIAYKSLLLRKTGIQSRKCGTA
jgi:hypothetical protein